MNTNIYIFHSIEKDYTMYIHYIVWRQAKKIWQAEFSDFSISILHKIVVFIQHFHGLLRMGIRGTSSGGFLRKVWE